MTGRPVVSAPTDETARLTPIDDKGFIAVDEHGQPWALYDDGVWERIIAPGPYVVSLLAWWKTHGRPSVGAGT